MERDLEDNGHRWRERDLRGGETIELPVHGASLAVDDIYDGIGLDAT